MTLDRDSCSVMMVGSCHSTDHSGSCAD